MKQILVFPDGSVAVVEEQDATHSVSISGQEPIQILPATEENLEKYFGRLKKPEIKVS